MKRIIILLLYFLCLKVTSQSYYNDARLWLNLYLEKKISKKFALHLNQKDRFDNNISRLELGYADVGVTYKFTQHVKILGDYVIAMNQKNSGSYGFRHQIYSALILSQEFNRWKIMYRNMFQVNYKAIYSSKEGMLPRFYDRNKLTLKYEATKRLSFYLAEELYVIVANPGYTGLSRSRSYAGMFISTTKKQQLELYFCLQAQLQKTSWYKQKKYYSNFPPENDYIYGVGYSIEF